MRWLTITLPRLITQTDNLIAGGVDQSRIFFVGNIMIDTLTWAKDRIKRPSVMNEPSIGKNEYFVVTLHRPSNVDDMTKLKKILSSIEGAIGDAVAVFPCSSQNRQRIWNNRQWRSDKICAC
jgi:UDP-N-acetylglucosamine 2-epimerase (non-hydrolysing)